MKEIIKTDRAPRAIGPYSHAVKAGGLIFLSGQIPIEPSSGNLLKEGIALQTRLVLENIRGILEDAGSTLKAVVKTTIYLKDISEFQVVNEVYKEFFHVDPPARATVEVSNLPRGAGIEIDVIAVGNE